MSEEPSAVANVAPSPATPSDDYDAICDALMQTARGRWFLQEYARRNRTADTQVLLAAIYRIEAVVCAGRTKQAPHEFRTDLLEMANAITRTRAEVDDIRSETAPPPRPAGKAATVRSHDVFAAAERIRDVTWAMRGHGFDPSICDQLEDLAASILSARDLRDPADHRVSKLSEVLQYLERRIGTLLQDAGNADVAEASAAAETYDRDLASPLRQELDDEAEPGEIGATSSGADEVALAGSAVGPSPRAEMVEPTEYPPTIEDESNGPSDSAGYVIEAADLPMASPVAVSELDATPEIEAPVAAEIELKAAPEAAPALEPAGLGPVDDILLVEATTPALPRPPGDASPGVPQPAIAAPNETAAESLGGAPDQDREWVGAMEVMRLAQALFEVRGPQEATLPQVAEIERTDKRSPVVPVVESQPLPAEIDLAGANGDLASKDDAPPSPVKLAWSADPAQATTTAEAPAAFSAGEEKPTAALEDTQQQHPVLPPITSTADAGASPVVRDPLAGLKAMSESELIALFS